VWTMTLGSAFVIWLGFGGAEHCRVATAFVATPGRAVLIDCGYWLGVHAGAGGGAAADWADAAAGLT